jgi:GNAT superfamily N-acetyltransferase
MPQIRLLNKSDLQTVNGILSRAFTQARIDDGYSHTHVPMCHPEFLNMYYKQCPAGCFVLEDAGQIRGAVFCHVWGETGWFGPLAIVPEKHHMGMGRYLVVAAINFLKDAGCRTIGLETNPRSNRNIGFYGKMDFQPSVLSIDLIKPVSPILPSLEEAPHQIVYFSQLTTESRQNFFDHVTFLSRAVDPLVDYTSIIETMDECKQGETVLFVRKGTPIALAVLQTEPSLVEEQNALMRVVAFMAHPKTPDIYFQYFLSDFLLLAKKWARDRILVRLPMYSSRLYRLLLDNNYRVVNTDIRMVLDGYPDQHNASRFHFNRWV